MVARGCGNWRRLTARSVDENRTLEGGIQKHLSVCKVGRTGVWNFSKWSLAEQEYSRGQWGGAGGSFLYMGRSHWRISNRGLP